MAVETSRDGVVAPGHDEVRRTVKHIDLRSVVKFSALFSATIGLVMLLAGGVLYSVASMTGVVGSIQSFFNHFGYPDFRVQPTTVFGVLFLITLVGAVSFTALAALGTFLFNLVAEAAGGIEMTFRE